MDTGKVIKLVVLNAVIVILNIVLFSWEVDGASSANALMLGKSIRITAIIMSVIVWGYGNYKLVMGRKVVTETVRLSTKEECIQKLRQNKVKTFAASVDTILEQIQRLAGKKSTINEMLLQKFNVGEMSYSKFQTVVNAVEEVFYVNIKSIINKINAFDEVDYLRLVKQENSQSFSTEVIRSKMEIYQAFLKFVQDSIEDNEEILLKLDQLLLELSCFNSLEDGEIENMAGMKEMDELISKTKLYK